MVVHKMYPLVDMGIQKIVTKLASLSFLADTYYLVLISESISLYGTRRKIRQGISKRM